MNDAIHICFINVLYGINLVILQSTRATNSSIVDYKYKVKFNLDNYSIYLELLHLNDKQHNKIIGY
jgi:hypothetical protein